MKRLSALPAVLMAALFALVAAPAAAAATAGSIVPHVADLSSVQHIVVLFPENHSFDNYFGTYPRALNPTGEPKFVAKVGTPAANVLTNALKTQNKNLYQPWRIDRKKAFQCNSIHKYTVEQQAAHGGKLDKFVQYTGPAKPTVDCPAKTPMGYYDGNTVTALWNYAQRFSMSDNTYGTTYGPSTVGAINLISGQTHGATLAPKSVATSVVNGTLIADPDPIDDCSTTTSHATMSGRNIGDLLNLAYVTWGWFEGGFKRTAVKADKGVCGTKHTNSAGEAEADYEAHHEPFQYYASTSNPHHLPPTSVAAIGTNADRAKHQYDLSSFWAAAANHTMPAVSFLKPPAYQDGHPGSSDPLAEQTWLVTTLNRIQQLPEWSSTIVIVVWDDSGGWYDHAYHAPVNPSNDAADSLNGAGYCGSGAPSGGYLDRCGYGPRLPLLVISPWSKSNYVDSTLNDQTSVMRLIEHRFLAGQQPADQQIGDSSFDANPSGGTLEGMLDFAHPNSALLLLDPTTGLKQ